MNRLNIVRNAAATLFIGFFGGDAFSHANLDFSRGMTPRSNSTNIKTPDIVANPCGLSGTPGVQAAAGDAGRMTLTPGQKLNVKWIETINHNAKYRLAFIPLADDVIAGPPYLMDVNSFDDDTLDPMDIAVADRQDGAGKSDQYFITVPATQCDECAIQFIQKMYPNVDAPATKYIGCMDIKIVDPATLAKPTAPEAVKIEWGK